MVISFPPCIGHTTIVTLCGFAYGMKGFYIAAPASLIGSSAAFVVLRLLFSRRHIGHDSTEMRMMFLDVVFKMVELIVGLFPRRDNTTHL